MPILRGYVEISSSLRVTISLFGGKSNGRETPVYRMFHDFKS